MAERRRWWIVGATCAGCLALGTLRLVLVAGADPGASGLGEEGPWQVPEPRNRAAAAAAALRRLEALQPWGAGDRAAATGELLVDSRYRLLGIVRQGDAPRAVFSDEAGELLRLAVGEALPDGPAVRAIEDNEVTVAAQGGIQTYRIHGDMSVSVDREDEET